MFKICISACIIFFSKIRKKYDDFWTLENWSDIFESIKVGEFVKSPVFKNDEGYEFEMHIYPKGRKEEDLNNISIFAFQGKSRLRKTKIQLCR